MYYPLNDLEILKTTAKKIERMINLNWYLKIWFLMVSQLLLFCAIATDPGCLLEPGYIMYGVVSSSTASPNAIWQVSSTSSSVAITASRINVNGQNFYLATIPFETRSVGGISLGAPTPNTLPLNLVQTTYARRAMVNGTNATIVYTSSGSTNTFIFGPADRNPVGRIDVSVPPRSFL